MDKKKRKIVYPDYKDCLANLPNSILQYLGAETKGASLPEIDEILKKDYKNIVVLLLDGMGQTIMERNLDENGFFRSHFLKTYSSVFPSTTVAATTSVMNGLMPNEHSWLGWDCYFPQIDKNVTVFRNLESDTDVPAADYPVANTYIPYVSVIDKINAAGRHAYWAMPYQEPYPDTFDAVCSRIAELCKLPEQKYIYAYWNEPDHFMHRNGCYCDGSVQLLRELEKQVMEMARKLDDTLLIVTADHGHMDSKGVSITAYPEIMDCLERLPSIEPRALNFFVKTGREKEFERLFEASFGQKFLLFSKMEVREKKLFGEGTEHPNFDGMLGDYLAVAIDDLSIYNTEEDAARTIGVHAGLVEDEMRIPLIVIEKK